MTIKHGKKPVKHCYLELKIAEILLAGCKAIIDFSGQI
jgi:hypothetical protein